MNELSHADIDRILTASGGLYELESAIVAKTSVRTYRRAAPHMRALLDRGRQWGERELVVTASRRVTFEQHYTAVAALAELLVARHGVAHRDRIAIAMSNTPEWSIAFWAIVSIGAIVVPLNAWWTGKELSFAVADAQCKLVIVDEVRSARLQPFREELKGAAFLRVGTASGNEVGKPEDFVLNAEALWATRSPRFPDRRIDSDDPATIFYTSGTTGKPKGAINTHRAISSFVLNATFARARAALTAGYCVEQAMQMSSRPTVTLVTTPFFHLIGCYGGLVLAQFLGGKMVLMSRWDPVSGLELIERERVTNLSGVPTVVQQTIDEAKVSNRDLSSLQAIAYSGAAAPKWLTTAIADVLPGRTCGTAYGLTEASGLVASVWGRDYIERPESVGRPLPTVDVAVHDERGHAVPVGEIGEIAVRSVGALSGYWNNEDATDAAIKDGWLLTGDLGRLDGDGFLFVVDRKKDVIIRGGENIYSLEVENALHSHPDIHEAAVIGLSDRALGEVVVAIVFCSVAAGLTSELIRAHVATQLAAYKVPSHVVIRHEPLPRNAAGKILKVELRAELTKARAP